MSDTASADNQSAAAEKVPGPDPSTLSYEEAKNELRAIVQSLESGSTPLEDQLNLWQRGVELAARCQEILDDAVKLINDTSGQASLQEQ